MADRVVFDTNISISGLLWRGAPYRAILLAKAKVIQAVYCDSILGELTSKLREDFEFDENHIEAVVYQLRQYADRVTIPGMLHVVIDDPEDDKFIECAVVAGARWIVTGDRHLLAIQEYQGVHILNAQDLLSQLESDEDGSSGQQAGSDDDDNQSP